MCKILIISGPTAAGKTAIAVRLAKLFNGELISADSRQVYRGMDIGTGKEIDTTVKTWGYDLVNPDEEWSTAHFVEFATKTIIDIQKRGKLPIVVGGTGLYIKHLLFPPETLFVAQDKKLRETLEKMTVKELQNKLQQINPKRFEQMNESDQKNPRRLVRAIEIATQSLKGPAFLKRPGLNTCSDTLHIVLTAPLDLLDNRIEERVQKRLDQGIEQEVRELAKKYSWESALYHTIAYQEWKPYIERERTTIKEVIASWTTHEKQYARRQLTWFRKQPDLRWLNITDSNYPKTVVSSATRWYDGSAL